MNNSENEDLRQYRTYFGLTMLQFLGLMALLGIVLTVLGDWIFG